jgi:hypothetical protein
MKNGLVVDKLGNKYWYKDDKLHREDGPAAEFVSGDKHWYKDNNLHREDGPAIERFDGSKGWWYKGIYAGEGDQPDPVLWERLTSVEINGGPLLNGYVVDLHGVKCWFKAGQLHHKDGPAYELEFGRPNWYFNGKNLGDGAKGFWKLWDHLTEVQRSNPNLLKHLPR